MRHVRISVIPVILAGMAAAGLWWAGPAVAHTDLVSSTPAEGARLQQPPTSVSLTFSDPMTADFSTVSLTVADEQPIKLNLAVRDATVEATIPGQKLTGTDPSGVPQWKVNYRVVSADGHPVTGSLAFSAPLPRASWQRPPSRDAASTGSVAPNSSSEVPESARGDYDRLPGWWALVVGVGLALPLAGGLGIAALGRRRSRSGSDG